MPGYFELWLRAEPKPKGGRLSCGSMDDELPVLHWLLREQAAEVFQGLVGTHLKRYTSSFPGFLAKRARTPDISREAISSLLSTCTPSVAPDSRAGRLAQEVQDAATSLGIPFRIFAAFCVCGTQTRVKL